MVVISSHTKGGRACIHGARSAPISLSAQSLKSMSRLSKSVLSKLTPHSLTHPSSSSSPSHHERLDAVFDEEMGSDGEEAAGDDGGQRQDQVFKDIGSCMML